MEARKLDDESQKEKKKKRPMNAFFLFCKRHRSDVRQMYPEMDNRTVTRTLGDIWASLDKSEKEQYVEMANELKNTTTTTTSKENPQGRSDNQTNQLDKPAFMDMHVPGPATSAMKQIINAAVNAGNGALSQNTLPTSGRKTHFFGPHADNTALLQLAEMCVSELSNRSQTNSFNIPDQNHPSQCLNHIPSTHPSSVSISLDHQVAQSPYNHVLPTSNATTRNPSLYPPTSLAGQFVSGQSCRSTIATSHVSTCVSTKSTTTFTISTTSYPIPLKKRRLASWSYDESRSANADLLSRNNSNHTNQFQTNNQTDKYDIHRNMDASKTQNIERFLNHSQNIYVKRQDNVDSDNSSGFRNSYDTKRYNMPQKLDSMPQKFDNIPPKLERNYLNMVNCVTSISNHTGPNVVVNLSEVDTELVSNLLNLPTKPETRRRRTSSETDSVSSQMSNYEETKPSLTVCLPDPVTKPESKLTALLKQGLTGSIPASYERTSRVLPFELTRSTLKKDSKTASLKDDRDVKSRNDLPKSQRFVGNNVHTDSLSMIGDRAMDLSRKDKNIAGTLVNIHGNQRDRTKNGLVKKINVSGLLSENYISNLLRSKETNPATTVQEDFTVKHSTSLNPVQELMNINRSGNHQTNEIPNTVGNSFIRAGNFSNLTSQNSLNEQRESLLKQFSDLQASNSYTTNLSQSYLNKQTHYVHSVCKNKNNKYDVTVVKNEPVYNNNNYPHANPIESVQENAKFQPGYKILNRTTNPEVSQSLHSESKIKFEPDVDSEKKPSLLSQALSRPLLSKTDDIRVTQNSPELNEVKRVVNHSLASSLTEQKQMTPYSSLFSSIAAQKPPQKNSVINSKELDSIAACGQKMMDHIVEKLFNSDLAGEALQHPSSDNQSTVKPEFQETHVNEESNLVKTGSRNLRYLLNAPKECLRSDVVTAAVLPKDALGTENVDSDVSKEERAPDSNNEKVLHTEEMSLPTELENRTKNTVSTFLGKPTRIDSNNKNGEEIVRKRIGSVSRKTEKDSKSKSGKNYVEKSGSEGVKTKDVTKTNSMHSKDVSSPTKRLNSDLDSSGVRKSRRTNKGKKYRDLISRGVLQASRRLPGSIVQVKGNGAVLPKNKTIDNDAVNLNSKAGIAQNVNTTVGNKAKRNRTPVHSKDMKKQAGTISQSEKPASNPIQQNVKSSNNDSEVAPAIVGSRKRKVRKHRITRISPNGSATTNQPTTEVVDTQRKVGLANKEERINRLDQSRSVHRQYISSDLKIIRTAETSDVKTTRTSDSEKPAFKEYDVKTSTSYAFDLNTKPSPLIVSDNLLTLCSAAISASEIKSVPPIPQTIYNSSVMYENPKYNSKDTILNSTDPSPQIAVLQDKFGVTKNLQNPPEQVSTFSVLSPPRSFGNPSNKNTVLSEIVSHSTKSITEKVIDSTGKSDLTSTSNYASNGNLNILAETLSKAYIYDNNSEIKDTHVDNADQRDVSSLSTQNKSTNSVFDNSVSKKADNDCKFSSKIDSVFENSKNDLNSTEEKTSDLQDFKTSQSDSEFVSPETDVSSSETESRASSGLEIIEAIQPGDIFPIHPVSQVYS